MKCPNCKTEVPESARFCTNCGESMTGITKSQKRKIRIYGYKEWYAITWDTDIFLNGKKVGTIRPKGVLEVEVGDKDCYFEFQWHQGFGIVSKGHCFVNSTFNGGLQLVTNRFTASIKAEYTM